MMMYLINQIFEEVLKLQMSFGVMRHVLAGDFLFAQSFDLMVDNKSIKALSVLAQASCKITQGEFLQMQI